MIIGELAKRLYTCDPTYKAIVSVLVSEIERGQYPLALLIEAVMLADQLSLEYRLEQMIRGTKNVQMHPPDRDKK